MYFFFIVLNIRIPNAEPFTAEWDTQFKGLYLPIPLRCYSSDGRYLLLRSISGSRTVLYIYDFTEGKNSILLIHHWVLNTSINGLAIFGHYVAVNVVDCRTPYRLYVFDLNTLNKDNKDGWHLIAEHEFKKKKKIKFNGNLIDFFLIMN